MPKKKTSKTAAKRMSKTARGKLKFRRANRGHLLSSKSRKRKRNLRQGGILSHVEQKRMSALLSS